MKKRLLTLILAIALSTSAVPAALLTSTTVTEAAQADLSKATALVGKKLKLSKIKKKVGKWQSFRSTKNCTGGGYTGKLQYSGFAIYLSSSTGSKSKKWKITNVR